MRRIGFEFLVNYHSAAELLLYGTGWQVATPDAGRRPSTRRMAGDDANPAVPGYDPDISAELYTTNGDTTTTPTRPTAPSRSPRRCPPARRPAPRTRTTRSSPRTASSVFDFPDSEPLIQAEFEKNIPFALAVARSAQDPSNPVSVVGRTAPNFVLDPFTVSYGTPQPVAVTARRDLQRPRAALPDRRRRRAAGGRRRNGRAASATATRATSTTRSSGAGRRRPRRARRSRSGSPACGPARGSGRQRSGSPTPWPRTGGSGPRAGQRGLRGLQPRRARPAVTAPRYAQQYVDRADRGRLQLRRLGRVGAGRAARPRRAQPLRQRRLVPRRQPADPGRGGRPHRDVRVRTARGRVRRRAPAVPDARGPRLPQRRRHPGAHRRDDGVLRPARHGARRHLLRPGRRAARRTASSPPTLQRLPAARRRLHPVLPRRVQPGAAVGPDDVDGTGAPIAGTDHAAGGHRQQPARRGRDVPADQRRPPAGPSSRSSPAPCRASTRAARPATSRRSRATGSPRRGTRTTPTCGWPARSTSRRRRGRRPTLEFALSFDVEEGYDNVIVEAHPVGTDDWTTLPEAGGLTDTTPPTECEVGFLLDLHPFLSTTSTEGDPCATPADRATGTGSPAPPTAGSEVAFDLSGYAGAQVEVAISYVTDPFTGGAGVFVDRTRLVIGGTGASPRASRPRSGRGRRPAHPRAARRTPATSSGRSPRSGPRSPPTTPCCSGSASSRCPTRRPAGRSSARS